MAIGYQTTVQIDSFAGINQSTGERSMPMKYAVDGENFLTTGGLLQSMDGGQEHVPAALPAPIGTLMLLFRRFRMNDVFHNEPELLIAAAGDKLYARPLNSKGALLEEWYEIYSGITNDSFDYVTYEANSYWTLEGKRVAPNTEGAVEVLAENPIDILIMSNADDGMFIVYGDSLDVTPYTIKPTTTDVEKKFGVLTRHAERIWGAAIPDQPDMLMYSVPYEPLNWEQNNDFPEDGAGDIQQPSWDGDSFVALRVYGSYLLAIKKNKVWRIAGTNPGEYYMKEQFGGGTIVENTVVVYNDYMFLLSYDGLMMYDGTAVQPFRQQYVKEIMERLNWAKVGNATAAMRGTIYCLALPLDGSDVNNAILEYDTTERTFNLRYGVYVSSFLPYENMLYYTDSRDKLTEGGLAGRVMKLDGNGEALPMRYITAFQDLGYKSVTKSGFEVYMLADTPMTVTVGIRTEKKLKTKTVNLVADKAKRVRLNAVGRSFRLELEVPGGQPWKIGAGLQINMELDED